MGIWDVENWLYTISWYQLKFWLEYYEIEPFGEERADLRSYSIVSMIANANRDAKKRPQPYLPSDFMPKFDEKLKVKKVVERMTSQSDFNRFRSMLRGA